jgi:hypothetical protein
MAYVIQPQIKLPPDCHRLTFGATPRLLRPPSFLGQSRHGAYPPAYVGATLKRLLNLPLVVWPHGSDVLPGEFIRANARLERRLKKGLAAADLVIAQSEFLQRELLALRVPVPCGHRTPDGRPSYSCQYMGRATPAESG